MRLDGDEYTLSSGKTFYANNGIVGIDPELRVHEGYDGSVDYHGDTFTAAEKIELADYMIALWTKYKTDTQEGRV